MSNNLKEVLATIKQSVKQHSASAKDEITVMQSMLNDREYGVEIYHKNGSTGEFYYPAQEFRGMVSDIVASTTKIGKDEASAIIDDYDFKRSQAKVMVDISKEFINTYLETDRKLKLGGRQTSNVSLMRKDFPSGKRRYPSRIGVRDNGEAIIEAREIWVDSYSGIKASSPCPPWVSKEKR